MRVPVSMHPQTTIGFSQENQQEHSVTFEVSYLKQRGRTENKHESAGTLCVVPTTSNKELATKQNSIPRTK